MADVTKYVSLENLATYDGLIKGKMATDDAAVLASAQADAKAKADAVDTKLATEVTRAKAAEEANAAAAKTADDKAVAAQGEVDALEALVGTLPEGATATTVVGYVDAKTANIASSATVSALSEKMTQAEADIDAIEADYLKGADKTELQENIDTVSGAVERLTNGVSAEEIDGVNDLIAYVNEHGTEVTGMKEDIAENATAIEGVAGRMATAEGKITTLEGEMDTVQADVAKKVDQEAYNTKIAALESADTTISGKVTALEGKFGEGEGTVGDMISDAISTEATRVDTELAKKIETVKVNGVALTMDANKAVDVVVPTDNASLTNGAGYLVADDIKDKADKATTLAGYGITDTYTKTETDTAISNAVAAIQPVTTDEINALFA